MLHTVLVQPLATLLLLLLLGSAATCCICHALLLINAVLQLLTLLLRWGRAVQQIGALHSGAMHSAEAPCTAVHSHAVSDASPLLL
jgi:hypothetical protein